MSENKELKLFETEEKKKEKEKTEELPPNGIRYVRVYGHTIIIKDKDLTLEDIRKKIAQKWPEFADKKKVIMDYNPKTGLIVPIRTAGTKGAEPLPLNEIEAIFRSFDDMFKNPYPINYVCNSEEGIYEVRKTEVGFFIRPYLETPKGFRRWKNRRFIPLLPKIPKSVLRDAVDLFRRHLPNEQFVQILFNKAQRKYFLYHPPQKATPFSVSFTLEAEIQRDPNLIAVMDMHSHPDGCSWFSPTDDENETATGLYAIVLNAASEKPELLLRANCGGMFFELNPCDVFELEGGADLA